MNLNTWAARPITMAPSTQGKLIRFDLTDIWPLGGLTGTPTISVIGSGDNAPVQTYDGGPTVSAADITFGGPIVNTSSFKDDAGQTVGIGFGVQCQVKAAVDGGDYALKVTASNGTSTDSLYIVLQIRGDGAPMLSANTRVAIDENPPANSNTNPPNMLVFSSADPIIYGQTATLTAAAAPAASMGIYPTGTMTFVVDDQPQAPVSVGNGLATLTLSGLAIGSHDIVASYSGDANFQSAISIVFTQAVVAAARLT